MGLHSPEVIHFSTKIILTTSESMNKPLQRRAVPSSCKRVRRSLRFLAQANGSHVLASGVGKPGCCSMPNIKNTSSHAGDLECRHLSCYNTMSYPTAWLLTLIPEPPYRYFSASAIHQRTPSRKGRRKGWYWYLAATAATGQGEEPREVDGMANSKNEYPFYPSTQWSRDGVAVGRVGRRLLTR